MVIMSDDIREWNIQGEPPLIVRSKKDHINISFIDPIARCNCFSLLSFSYISLQSSIYPGCGLDVELQIATPAHVPDWNLGGYRAYE